MMCVFAKESERKGHTKNDIFQVEVEGKNG
jgi:hypothetical protein